MKNNKDKSTEYLQSRPSPSSELERFIMNHEALQPGDKLEGKIIDIKPNRNLLIDFGDFRALAEAAFPIKVGDIIHVVVESKYPKLRLKLEAPHMRMSSKAKVFDVKV